jgi:hypothetical protein
MIKKKSMDWQTQSSTLALNALTFKGIDKYGWNRHTYDIPLTMAPSTFLRDHIADLKIKD